MNMITIPMSKQFKGVFGLINGLDGYKYVVPGWYQVPEDTQREDIYIDPNQSLENEEPIQSFKEEIEFIKEVISSKGDKSYQITKSTEGSWRCTCPANQWQKGDCKHIKKIKKELKYE